ncbi:MAG: hypothetical protein IIB02_09485 [Thaumarchaeota archaeon]|nr:hypothetical protein [Nitrososphaerota archaeon]
MSFESSKKGPKRVRLKHFEIVDYKIDKTMIAIENFIASIGGEENLISVIPNGDKVPNWLVVYRG